MRYRGREDICYKSTDEARLGSDESSFTEAGFGAVFWYFVFTQNFTSYSIQIRKKYFGFSKAVLADII